MREGWRALLLGLVLLSCHAPGDDQNDNHIRIAASLLPPSNAHPFMGLTLPQTMVHQAVYDTLTVLADGSEPQPNLALSWAQLGPLHWRFNLRPGVQFSNGVSFDASQVVAAMEWLKTKDGKITSVGTDLAFIHKAEAIDDLTVDFHLAKPNTLMPRAVSTLRIPEAGAMAAQELSDFSKAPVGTGPFVVTNWDANAVYLRAHTASWRAPQIDALSFLILPDTISRLQALLSGAADVALDIAPDDARPVENAGGKILARQSAALEVIAFITQGNSLTRDIRVRKAINHAIDRQQLVDILLNAATEPVARLAGPFSTGFDPSIPGLGYNPDKARALLDQAGVQPGTSLTLEAVLGSSPNDSVIFQQIANDLRDVGLTLKIRRIPANTFLKHFFNGGWTGDMFRMSYGGYDPLRQFRYHSCAWRAPFFCEPKVADAVEAAKNLADTEERRAAAQAVLALDQASVSAVYLWQSVRFDAVSSAVKDLPSYPSYFRFHLLEKGASQ